VWDLAVSDDGTPATVYASFPSRTHHRYHWAFCEDGRWHDRILVENSGGSIADTTIAQPQYYYSGGLALDGSDIRTVYLSRRNGDGGWDVERWRTPDDGTTWSVEAMTDSSPLENVRPVVPLNRPASTDMVLWMSGTYDFYRNEVVPRDDYYDTGIMLWVSEEQPAATGAPEEQVAAHVKLGPCTPNPSRGVTRMDFTLPSDQRVSLDVYDVAGRRVRSLLTAEVLPRGRRTVVWDGTDRDGREVASGVYLARLRADDGAATAKILVLR
jgi:hypothetical protein